MILKSGKRSILPALCILVALSAEAICATASNHDLSKKDIATTSNGTENARQLKDPEDEKELDAGVDISALRRRIKGTKATKGSKGSKKEKEGSEGSKKAKGTKVPKGPKKKQGKKDKGVLQEDLAKAIAMKEKVQGAFNYDATSARVCRNASDDHQHCVYEILVPGTDFACECRPTNGAQVFGEVDANDDNFITLAEILNYFDGQECDFPFQYTFEEETKSYNSCTTIDDDFGFSWCSIKTLADGSHATGFWKYCDQASNEFAWNDALDRLDSDGDGKLSFDEAIYNARRRRKLLTSPGAFGAEWNCNDCVVPDDCANPVIQAIDGECRNYIKTKPLNDPILLRLLASAMGDVYCPRNDDEIGGRNNYLSCERKREGMENWLTRDDANMVVYDEDPEKFLTFLSCSALVVSGVYNTGARLLGIANGLSYLLGFETEFIAQRCIDFLIDFPTFLDGEDALQYAMYTINQGEHQGKTILSFMGTELTNIEQIVADIWSTPMATDLMRNMANEAKEVAERLNPDFITGHSLGGIIAEMVCSMTGIKGASFGAIGAFDPFTILDEVAIGIIDDVVGQSYQDILGVMGYSEDAIDQLIADLSIEEVLIATEYNGLILDTQHDGVEFEVVMNVHDIPGRTISSFDGSSCSHIASSCDLRWTWFGSNLNPFEKTFGHSRVHYVFNTNSKWTRGYDPESQATIDYSKIFLPDVSPNVICDFCDRDEYCESGSCDAGKEQCLGTDGLFPTTCPDDSVNAGDRSPCNSGDECSSGRCEFHPNPIYGALWYGLCHDKLANSEWCNEDNDCASDYCNWTFVCAEMKEIGEGCVEHDDCLSGNCNWLFRCS